MYLKIFSERAFPIYLTNFHEKTFENSMILDDCIYLQDYEKKTIGTAKNKRCPTVIDTR